MGSLWALGREMGPVTSPAARLVMGSIQPRTAAWWQLRRSNRNSGKRSATLSISSPSFAMMGKTPQRRKPASPRSLRPRRQTSGAPASLAKIVAARSLPASLTRLWTRITLLAACSTTYSPIPKVPPCQHSPCHSIRAFGQSPQWLSLRLHSVPTTGSTWHELRKFLCRPIATADQRVFRSEAKSSRDHGDAVSVEANDQGDNMPLRGQGLGSRPLLELSGGRQ